jgi:23S rRNA (pseudouridine1915-N3)-methyltransferase
MRIAIAAVGRLKAGPETDLCRRYLERARKTGSGLGLKGFDVHEVPEGAGATTALRQKAEAEALTSCLPARAETIVLDERGDLVDSAEFAALLRKRADAGLQDLVLVIGGPDGLGEGLRNGASRSIALGRMTWPHQIARVLLAEQLYRATTLLAGHPYHRA